jgi:hypothetical protein
MKRFVIVLVLIAAGVAGLGFYRGWFQVTSDTTDEKRNITFTADPNKIKEDEKGAVEKVKNAGQQMKKQTTASTEKNKDQTAGPVQPPQGQE